LIDFFSSEFKINVGEMVALMGAHTIGGMSTGGSGYTGKWTEDVRF